MALNSVNTNMGAMVALQSLNRTTDELSITSKRISTGLRVADAKDDGAAFAVAQSVRADVAGLTSANEQLGGAQGLLDTTNAAVKKVSDSMAAISGVLTKLGGTSISASEREQYTSQYNSLVQQTKDALGDATYNGKSLIGDSTATPATTAAAATVVRNENADQITIPMTDTANVAGAQPKSLTFALDTTVGGMTAARAKEILTGNTETTAAGPPPVTTVAAAADDVLTFAKIEKNVNTALNTYGNASKSISSQITFNKEKIDALEGGIGALVDADLAKESAKLQSLQIRQQLGSQALGIANQAPQTLLSLFR